MCVLNSLAHEHLACASEKPILVVVHPGISGGVFDHGFTGEGVLHLDLSEAGWFERAEFQQPFAEWLAEVEARRRL